jgi:hypothetical protein
MRLRRGLPLLSSLALDMLNLVFDVMAGLVAASVPLPASTLEHVSLAALIWIKRQHAFAVVAVRNKGILSRLGRLDTA